MARTGDNQTQQLETLAQVWRGFCSRSSPRLLLGGLALMVFLRVTLVGLTTWALWDLAAVVMVVVLAPIFEWFIHRFILHMPPRRMGRLLIDFGAGHRDHHHNPLSLDSAVLRAPDAVVFQVVNAAIAAALITPVLILTGAEFLGPMLTAMVAALAALTHYEWSHFLFHTAYRPRTRYYRRLKRNHRLHHFRNERYWLGVTGNIADRILGTYPASRSDAPVSATTRTLGIE